MPPKNEPSPFEIVTPGKSKKSGGKGIIIAVAVVIFLILSVIAGVLLVRQRQSIQEKAAGETCAPGYTTTHLHDCKKNCSNEQGPGADWYWINATTGAGCGTGTDGTPKYWCDVDECNLSTAVTTPTPVPTPSPTPSPTPTSSPTPTAAPNTCGGSCGSNSNCNSGLICSNGFCRNPLCVSASDCVCTSTSTSSPIPTATAIATTTTTTATQSSPRPVPVTGIDWPTVTGIGVGAAAIILSVLIAL